MLYRKPSAVTEILTSPPLRRTYTLFMVRVNVVVSAPDEQNEVKSCVPSNAFAACFIFAMSNRLVRSRGAVKAASALETALVKTIRIGFFVHREPCVKVRGNFLRFQNSYVGRQEMIDSRHVVFDGDSGVYVEVRDLTEGMNACVRSAARNDGNALADSENIASSTRCCTVSRPGCRCQPS